MKSFEKEPSVLMFSEKGKEEDFVVNIWEVRKGETSSRMEEVLCTEGNTDSKREQAWLIVVGSLLKWLPMVLASWSPYPCVVISYP